MEIVLKLVAWASDPAHSAFVRTLIGVLSMPGILWGFYLFVLWLSGRGIDQSIDDNLKRTKELQDDFRHVGRSSGGGTAQVRAADAQHGLKVEAAITHRSVLRRIALSLYFVLVGPALATVAAMYIYDRYFRPEITDGGQNGQKPPDPFCTPGKVVYIPRHTFFQIAFLIVDDNEKLNSIASVADKGDRDFVRAVYEAIRSGSVERFAGPGNLIIRLTGAENLPPPEELAYLTTSNTCEGTILPKRNGDGALLLSVPLSGDSRSSEISILFPYEYLNAATDPNICVQTSFPIVTPSKGRSNEYCGHPNAIRNALTLGGQIHRYLIIRNSRTQEAKP